MAKSWSGLLLNSGMNANRSSSIVQKKSITPRERRNGWYRKSFAQRRPGRVLSVEQSDARREGGSGAAVAGAAGAFDGAAPASAPRRPAGP